MNSKKISTSLEESTPDFDKNLRIRKLKSWLLVFLLLGPFINLFYAPTKNNWIKFGASIWLGIELTIAGVLFLLIPKSVIQCALNQFLFSSPPSVPPDRIDVARIRLLIYSLIILFAGLIFLYVAIRSFYFYRLFGSRH